MGPDVDSFGSRRSTVYGSRGVVATSQPLAAEAGLELPRGGANAFDAAVATAATLSVVEPTSTGLGGDVFALYRTADGEVGAMRACGGAPVDPVGEPTRNATGTAGFCPRGPGLSHVKRRALLVALLVVASGCNAFGGAGEAEPETPTLTPVEVPEADPVRTAPPTPTECLAPRVAAPERTPAPTPATPAPLPAENGTVSGAALVSRHTATLADYSFALRVGPTRIESMPGAVAFTYEGASLGFGSTRVFAVAGTIYRLHETEAGASVSERPYDPDAPENEWYVNYLTGRYWLAERVGRLDYARVGTRTWNGTEVRVLRDTFDEEVLVGAGEALSVDSTVFVDRRGVVRRVRHVRTLRSDEGDEVTSTTEVDTFTVTDVGSTTVTRPEAFCVPRSDVVAATASATPNATAGPFTAVPNATG